MVADWMVRYVWKMGWDPDTHSHTFPNSTRGPGRYLLPLPSVSSSLDALGAVPTNQIQLIADSSSSVFIIQIYMAHVMGTRLLSCWRYKEKSTNPELLDPILVIQFSAVYTSIVQWHVIFRDQMKSRSQPPQTLTEVYQVLIKTVLKRHEQKSVEPPAAMKHKEHLPSPQTAMEPFTTGCSINGQCVKMLMMVEKGRAFDYIKTVDFTFNDKLGDEGSIVLDVY
eukprot:Em0001g2855a